MLKADANRTPNYTWNAVAFAADSALFAIAMSLIGTSTVLPTFIARLTSSPIAVGLASGIVSAAWMLPQLIVASAVSGRTSVKPIIVKAAWLSRPLFLLLGVVIWFFAESNPGLTLATVLIGIGVFYVLDAVVSVPWFDLLSKCIPATRRGRVIGSAQVIGGVCGMGTGALIRYLLSPQSPWQYPQNYALLFVASSVVLLGSAVALTLIREPKSPTRTSAPSPGVRKVLRGLPGLLRDDRRFSRLVVVRILAGMISMANAFYVLQATTTANLPAEATGLLLSAQVAGSVASGLLMGVVQDRLGPLAHIRMTIAIASLPPLLALILSPFLGALGGAALYAYIAIFFLLGISVNSMGWPFFNWILEYAREERRGLYIGTINTLAALVMVAPPLGGWVVRVASYPTLFALTLAFGVAAQLLAVGLPSTRRDAHEDAQQVAAPGLAVSRADAPADAGNASPSAH